MLSPGRRKKASADNETDPPLRELSKRLEQLESSISWARTAYIESLRNPHAAGDGTSSSSPKGDSKDASSMASPSTFSRLFRRGRSGTPQKDRVPVPQQPPPAAAPTSTLTSTQQSPSSKSSTAKSDDGDETAADTNDDTANSSGGQPENIVHRPRSSSSSSPTGRTMREKILTDPEAKFVENLPDADAFVENLRRVAELVVVGENFVTTLQKREEARFKRDQEKWKAKRDSLELAMSGSSDDSSHAAQQLNDTRFEDDEHKDEYMQLFDLFFERSTLEMIINLLTGATFRLTDEEEREIAETLCAEGSIAGDADGDDADANDDSKSGGQDGNDSNEGSGTGERSKEKTASRAVILPPFHVATQALQSVSILIQNVSRATSLYFLLSNNLINDLINLPLGLYLEAERHRQLTASVVADTGDGDFESSHHHHQPMATFSSPELSEMTTHFITFLKSLALRMNAQTLQFFLKYPTEVAGGAVSSSHFTADGKLVDDQQDGHRGGEEEEGGGEALFFPESLRVDFPLYDRALEFCGSHQDSFVRLTAMNICLNTLRLTTVRPPEEDEEAEAVPPESELDESSRRRRSVVGCSSPDGVLHNAKPLPFRERLAIAHHACIPSRVELLISPIFTKLAERWNSLDEQIREIDSNKVAADADSQYSKTELAKEKKRREKLIRSFKDRAADLQDELLLLDDVFKVGLTVLNEQMVEMCLATFVYPLLLQPMLLFCQRLNSALKPAVPSTSDHPLGGSCGDFCEIERDLAQVAGPAKAALFSLASLFHLLSNKPLLRLISTALLHPLAPDSTGVPTLRSSLEVATVNAIGRKTIRLDRQTIISGDKSTYAFGTRPGNRRVSKAKVDLSVVKDGGEACVFVLSPALAEVLEFRGDDESLVERTRPNNYRRAVLDFIDIPADISGVRGLALHVLDAAFSALDGKFVADVVFGAYLKNSAVGSSADERKNECVIASPLDAERDLPNEITPSLCRCVLTASEKPARASEWSISFNEIAAHALLCCVRYNERASQIAATTAEKLWWKAASFIASIPSKIPPAAMGGSSIPMHGNPSVNDPDHDLTMRGAFMNFIFYDSMEPSDFDPVTETFLKVREKQKYREGYSVAISCESAFDSLCSQIGSVLMEGIEYEPTSLSDKEEIQLARPNVHALLKLDALAKLLNDMTSKRGAPIRESAAIAGIAVFPDGRVIDTAKEGSIPEVLKKMYAPLSSAVTKCIFDESLEKELPASGSAIDLTGNLLLPCVCEAPAALAHLFAASSSGVVSEGVTWQSLYVVITGSYLILAQPQLVEGSTKGRIITSCLLERLSVEKDEVAGDAGPPARRLLLLHKWFNPKPPTFFVFDAKPEYEIYGPFIRAKPFTSNLDVWFEDQSTSDHAFRVLTSQMFAAKAKRGSRVEKFLNRSV